MIFIPIILVFYMRSYAIAPKDPLNTLSLGLALLHASMQRKTDDRHLQVMQVTWHNILNPRIHY